MDEEDQRSIGRYLAGRTLIWLGVGVGIGGALTTVLGSHSTTWLIWCGIGTSVFGLFIKAAVTQPIFKSRGE